MADNIPGYKDMVFCRLNKQNSLCITNLHQQTFLLEKTYESNCVNESEANGTYGCAGADY